MQPISELTAELLKEEFNSRALVYAPSYPNEDMRWRIIQAQFIPLCKEVTHFALLKTMEPGDYHATEQ